MAPHFDSASLTPDMCKDACAYLGAEFTLAGITQGNVCLCGKDGSGKKINFQIFFANPLPNFLDKNTYNKTGYKIKIYNVYSLRFKVCPTPITVMGSVMGIFPLRNGVYLLTAIK